MSDRIPIGTIPGLVSQLVGVDILIGALARAVTVSRVFLRQTDYDDSGATDTSVTASVRNATGGGGEGISVEIADQTESGENTGALSVESDGSMYLRVSAASGGSMNLTGWVEVNEAGEVTAALTNLARVKEYGDIGTSDYDSLLTSLILGVSAGMERYMGRKIVQRTATDEKASPSGLQNMLPLRYYPIISITSIEEDGVALVEDTDFELEEQDKAGGMVARIVSGEAASWSAGTRNVKATYVHGYATTPYDLVMAATDQVRHEFLQSKEGGNRLGDTGQSTPSGSVINYAPHDWLPMVKRIMDSYRRID